MLFRTNIYQFFLLNFYKFLTFFFLFSIIEDVVPPSPGIEKGNEALCAAAERGDFWSLRKYLFKDFPVNGKDSRGWRPLQLASMGGSHACVRQLLAMPDIEIEPSTPEESLPLDQLLINPEKASPMLLASAKGHANCIRVLKEAGIKVSPLDVLAACAGGYSKCLTEILPDLNDTFPEEALILAAEGGFSNCVRLILEEKRSFQPDIISQALVVASAKGHYLCVKEILGYTTPSHDAWFVSAKEAHIECLRIILESDPSLLDARDRFNKSALQYVFEKENRDCVAMLLARGALILEPFSVLEKFINDPDISEAALDAAWVQSKLIPGWTVAKQLIQLNRKRLIHHPSIKSVVALRWHNSCRPFCFAFSLATLGALFLGRPGLIIFTCFLCQYLHILPSLLAINLFEVSLGTLLLAALCWYHHGYHDSFSYFPLMLYSLINSFSIKLSNMVLLFLPLLTLYRNINRLSTTNILFQTSIICLLLNQIFLFRIFLIPPFSLALSILILCSGSQSYFYFSSLDILLTLDLCFMDWVKWCEIIKFIIKSFIGYQHNLILWYINK